MALIDKPEVGREDGEILVAFCQTVECDPDPNTIPELRERHPSGSRKDTADVKTCVTESLGQFRKIRASRVRDDRVASIMDEAAVVGSGCRAAGGEAPRNDTFGKCTDEPGEPLVKFETINAPP